MGFLEEFVNYFRLITSQRKKLSPTNGFNLLPANIGRSNSNQYNTKNTKHNRRSNFANIVKSSRPWKFSKLKKMLCQVRTDYFKSLKFYKCIF